MGVIIDANIISGYFKATVLNIAHGLTSDPSELFENEDEVYFDDNDLIETEWRNVCNRENFANNLIRDLLVSGKGVIIDVPNCPAICKSCRTLGFPRSKDTLYVKTAHAVMTNFGRATIVTEDIDFYDPKLKNSYTGSARLKFLRSNKGNMLKHLKSLNIFIKCVENYI